MQWHEMTWEAKFSAVVDVFGTTNSDCGADELMHLWEQIQDRNLQDTFLVELAQLLGLPTYPLSSSATHIMQMMTVSEVDYHWPAALKAAGRWMY